MRRIDKRNAYVRRMLDGRFLDRYSCYHNIKQLISGYQLIMFFAYGMYLNGVQYLKFFRNYFRIQNENILVTSL